MTPEQASEVHGWCPDCNGSGMVMEFEPADCPNLNLHRAIEESATEGRASE